MSLALQVFYPDFFNGAWSHCPDPVDFRALEVVDLYRDPKNVSAVRAEFAKSTEGITYKPYIPPGPPKVP